MGVDIRLVGSEGDIADVQADARSLEIDTPDIGGSLSVVAVSDDAQIGGGSASIGNLDISVAIIGFFTAGPIEAQVVSGIRLGSFLGIIASGGVVAVVESARIIVVANARSIHADTKGSKRRLSGGSGITSGLQALVEVVASGARTIGFASAQSGAKVASLNAGEGLADTGENLRDEGVQLREVGSGEDLVIGGHLSEIIDIVTISTNGDDVDSVSFGITCLGGESVGENVLFSVSEQDDGFLNTGTRGIVEDDGSLSDTARNAGTSSVDGLDGVEDISFACVYCSGGGVSILGPASFAAGARAGGSSGRNVGIAFHVSREEDDTQANVIRANVECPDEVFTEIQHRLRLSCVDDGGGLVNHESNIELGGTTGNRAVQTACGGNEYISIGGVLARRIGSAGKEGANLPFGPVGGATGSESHQAQLIGA